MRLLRSPVREGCLLEVCWPRGSWPCRRGPSSLLGFRRRKVVGYSIFKDSYDLSGLSIRI